MVRIITARLTAEELARFIEAERTAEPKRGWQPSTAIEILSTDRDEWKRMAVGARDRADRAEAELERMTKERDAAVARFDELERVIKAKEEVEAREEATCRGAAGDERGNGGAD